MVVAVLTLFVALLSGGLSLSLQSWMESRGVSGKKIQISDINGSPVAIASKMISEGDVVLTIPRNQVIMSNNLPEFTDKSLSDEISSPLFKMGFYFLDELDKKHNEVSYRDYIRACGYAYNPAVLWNDKSIELLKGSPIEKLAREGKEDIKETFKEYKDKAKGELMKKGKWNDISDAMRLVLSHTISIKEGNDEDDVLLFAPLLGILRQPSEYSKEKGNVHLVIPEDNEEPLKLVANESIPILGEITIDYSNLQKKIESDDKEKEDGDEEAKKEKGLNSQERGGEPNSTILLKSGHVIGKINLNPEEKSSKSIVTDNDVSNIYDVYLLHFSPESKKDSKKSNNSNDEEENEAEEESQTIDILKELKQALLKASHLPSGAATVAVSKGELDADKNQEIRGIPEALLVMLRIHLAKNEEFGNIGNALKGNPISLENELIMCRSLVSTIQNILDGYEHNLQEDVNSYTEAMKEFASDEVRKNYKLGEKLSALKYTLIERDLLITVARNIQFHWMRFLEV